MGLFRAYSTSLMSSLKVLENSLKYKILHSYRRPNANNHIKCSGAMAGGGHQVLQQFRYLACTWVTSYLKI